MIPLGYREQVPPYWYETKVAEYHFEGAGGELDKQQKGIATLGEQLLLPYATYSLDVWDWIFFGRVQHGADQKRREAIRKKYLAKASFTMPTLRLIGGMAGELLHVAEDFPNKLIRFEFRNSKPIELPGLYEDFEQVRPVHVNKAVEAVFVDASNFSVATTTLAGETTTIYPWTIGELSSKGFIHLATGTQTLETVTVYP